jgi:hypothetical protein
MAKLFPAVAVLSVSVLLMWLFVESQSGRFALPGAEPSRTVATLASPRLSSRDVHASVVRRRARARASRCMNSHRLALQHWRGAAGGSWNRT